MYTCSCVTLTMWFEGLVCIHTQYQVIPVYYNVFSGTLNPTQSINHVLNDVKLLFWHFNVLHDT